MGFSGPVLSLLDGDTIEVPNGGFADRLRLSGIACSEIGESYVQCAKQAASALPFTKDVTVQTRGYDKCTLADMILRDGNHANHSLINTAVASCGSDPFLISENKRDCNTDSLVPTPTPVTLSHGSPPGPRHVLLEC